MKLFSEKVEPTFTDSNINILGVRNFKEIFVDVFEFEINGKKFIAEKVSDHKGMPVVNIPVVLKGGEYTAPFALRRGVIEILFNEDNATFVKPVLEEVHELLEQHSENEKEEIYSFIKNTVEESTNKLSSDIENNTKYVESLVNEKIINLTTNTIPNIFLKNMKGSDDSNLVEIKERLESIGSEIDDVKVEKESIYTDLKALAEETSHLSENVDKKINNTLSRVGSIKAALENSIESAVGDLNKKIEDVETNIERYYSEKITNVSNEVHELTEQNKQDLIEIIESSKQSILEEISLIKNNVPNIVIEKANGKQEIDLKGIKTELEKIIGTKFSTEIAALRRLIEMSSGGGSVAKQFANGGTMDGNLTVVGTISAQSYAGIPNPDLTQYLPISGGTVTGNLTVNGTLSTTLLEALSANITVIDIKQYELSGFNVTGNATVQGSISATGDLTVHKRLNFAGDANGANNLYFVRNSTNNWTWGSNGVGDIMGIAGNSVTIGQDTTFTRQGITIRNLGETTGATLLGEAPDVLAQRRRTGTAPQEFRLYGLYDGSGANREYAYIKSLSASSFTIGTSATGTGANRSLEFQTAGSTRMTITSTGNVGIGTTAPSSLLFLQNPDISSGAESTITIQKPNTTSVETYATARWTGDFGNGFNLIHTGFNTNTSGLPNHAAVFQTNNSNGIVIGNGNISGIYAQFTTSTDKRFNIYSITDKTFANYERLSFKPQTGGSFLISSEAAGVNTGYRSIEFQNGGSTRMTITSAGNVGIGTTTPRQRIDVLDGQYMATVSANSNWWVKMYQTSTEGRVEGSANLEVIAGTGAGLYFKVGSTTAMHVNASNNVGIGTTSPNQKLTVVGSISTIGTTDLATFQSTTTQTPNIKIIGTDRNVTLTPAANGGNGTGLTGPSFYNAVRDSSSNSVRFQAVNSNGTVTYFQLWDDNATGVLAQRSGAIPQESRIYGAYTDASNYERFFIKTNVGATSATQIGLSAAGTGQNRNLEFVTGGSTRMTIATNGHLSTTTNASFAGYVAPSYLRLTGNTGEARIYKGTGDGSFAFYTQSETSRCTINVATDGVLKVRNITNTDYAVADAQIRLQGTAPASATDTGTAGDIRYDADYIYICVATNTWKRAAIATWP